MDLQSLRCSIRVWPILLAALCFETYQLNKVLACPWRMVVVHFAHYRAHCSLQYHILHRYLELCYSRPRRRVFVLRLIFAR